MLLLPIDIQQQCPRLPQLFGWYAFPVDLCHCARCRYAPRQDDLTVVALDILLGKGRTDGQGR